MKKGASPACLALWTACTAQPLGRGSFKGKKRFACFLSFSFVLLLLSLLNFQEATVVLEAVVSQDLWFWHAFFCLPGSHNDINILNVSPLFTKLLNGVAPKCEFTINGNKYKQGYYLADGIYPDYATLVKTISQPQGIERKVRKITFVWK
jgi:hypothetical protein